MSKITKGGLLKIGDAAKVLGVSIQTLRRWDEAGKLKPVVTPGGTRLYTRAALEKINPSLAQPAVQVANLHTAPISSIQELQEMAREPVHYKAETEAGKVVVGL